MKQSVAYYHFPCPDGAFAALACRMALGAQVQLIPYEHSKRIEQIPDPAIFFKVFLLDCIGSAGFIGDCLKAGLQVIVIDHHKSVVDDLKQYSDTADPLQFITHIAMNRSGCALAAQYFRLELNPNLQSMFNYIEDHDLWRFQLEDSKVFAAGLRRLQPSWRPDDLHKLLDLTPYSVIAQGHPQLLDEETWIQQALEYAYQVVLGDQLYMATDSTRWEIVSELGHRLSQKTGYGAIYNPETRQVSVRGATPANDVSIYAKQRGGGGHAGAAGFTAENWYAEIKKQ